MEQIIQHTLNTLQKGGLILYPTDTIWGIGCDATQEKAIDRIYQLKKRDDQKSLVILLANERDIMHYTVRPHAAIFDYLKKADRPTTVIYEKAVGLPANVVNADGSIAIRITRDPFCKALIKRLRKPLVSTSANISGMPAPANFAGIADEIKQGVDDIVNYRQSEKMAALPSRIVKIHPDGRLEIIRG